MPEIPRMLPSRRCFARIDRFECECPNCGRLIFTGIDRRFLPKRLANMPRARGVAKQRPRASSVLRLFWNPYTQRMQCPFCEKVYTLGLLLYPVKGRGRRVAQPAPDVEPTPAEVAEMRRLAGGWFVKRVRLPEEHANQVVTAECCCPEYSTAPSCPLHGEQVVGVAEAEAGAGTREGGETE
jgi:hypothetical protein